MDDIVRYRTAEAARMAGVSPSTLRLWESQGLLEPNRTPTGQRVFDSGQIERIKRIAYLRTEEGLNPAAIRQALKGGLGAALTPERDLPPPATPAAQSGSDVGRKIRHLRRAKGKTLEQVARDLDLAVSALSTFERNSLGLSLKALHDLAAYFGTTVSALTGERKRRARESLVRAGDWTSWPESTTGVKVQNLARGRHQMDCHRFVLAPGASSEGAYDHDGEEFIHCLSGRMEIVLDGDNFFTLEAGDSFYFESRRPHSWRNAFDGETVLLWINTPPTF